MKPERADKRAGGVKRELSKISIVTSEYLPNFLETVDYYKIDILLVWI